MSTPGSPHKMLSFLWVLLTRVLPLPVLFQLPAGHPPHLAGHALRNAALCLPCSDPPPWVPAPGHVIINCTPLVTDP